MRPPGSVGVDRAGRQERGRSVVTGVVVATLLAGYPCRAVSGELSGNVVVAADARTVTWAAIHRRPAPEGEDPWYHIEVIEKERRSEPWIFRRLSAHMAIAGDALLASRAAKTPTIPYGYKNEQFIGAYGEWRRRPPEARDVCRRSVLDCLKGGKARARQNGQP